MTSYQCQTDDSSYVYDNKSMTNNQLPISLLLLSFCFSGNSRFFGEYYLTRMPFSQRPISRLAIESQTLII